jgi:hypothetical protein
MSVRTMNWTHILGHALKVPQNQMPGQSRESKCAFFASLGMVRRTLDQFRHPRYSWTPQDTVTGRAIPLGLNFLRFDREKTYQLITKFTKLKEVDGKLTSFANDPGSV